MGRSWAPGLWPAAIALAVVAAGCATQGPDPTEDLLLPDPYADPPPEASPPVPPENRADRPADGGGASHNATGTHPDRTDPDGNTTFGPSDPEPGGAARSGHAVVNWRGGPLRQGIVDGVVPDEVVLAHQVPGINKGRHTAAKGSPVLAGDLVLVASDTGTLYAFDDQARVVWAAATHPSGFGIHGTASADASAAYIGAYDGAMYAFALEDGRQLWRTQVADHIGASPLLHDGVLYISAETNQPSGVMAALDPTTGAILWRDDEISDHPHSSPALDPDTGILVVGANDGILYAWDAASGAPLWRMHTGGAIKAPIMINDGHAFFGSWDQKVYSVALDDGTVRWSHTVDGRVMSGAAYDPALDRVYIGSHDGHLYALDADDGARVWRTQLHG